MLFDLLFSVAFHQSWKVFGLNGKGTFQWMEGGGPLNRDNSRILRRTRVSQWFILFYGIGVLCTNYCPPGFSDEYSPVFVRHWEDTTGHHQLIKLSRVT